MKRQALKSVLMAMQPKKEHTDMKGCQPETEQKISIHFPTEKIPQGLNTDNAIIGSEIKLNISGIITSIDKYGISLDIDSVNAIQTKKSEPQDKKSETDTDE